MDQGEKSVDKELINVNDLIDSFCFFSKVSVSFNDRTGKLAALIGRRYIGHGHPACLAVKSVNMAQCNAFETSVTDEIISGRRFQWKKCHAGFLEIILPIEIAGRVEGSLSVGLFEPRASHRLPRDVLTQKASSEPRPIKMPGQNLLAYEGRSSEHFLRLARVLKTLVESRLEVLSLPSGSIPEAAFSAAGRKKRIQYFYQKRFHLPGLKLADLAKDLLLSPARSSQILKKEFGKTFSEMLNEFRMERAKELLKITDYSAGTISRACGYTEPGYFFRMFQKHVGVTPGAFRKSQK